MNAPTQEDRLAKQSSKLITATVAMLALLATGHTQKASNSASAHGEVLWDTYGVPHVYAKSESGVFYGFGWAQAHSHGDLILRLYGQARGRAAEYWGAQYVDSDRWVIANGVYPRAAEWFKQLTPQFQADLNAFAAGVNAYAAAHPDEIDPKVKLVLPLSGIDILAHAHRLANYTYVASESRVMGGPPSLGGSNAWAVAPSKSTSGHSLLLANPHLPWAPGQLTYFEANLEGPDIHMYGATQIGLPVLRFCFNRNLGFTNTVNQIPGDTLYKIEVKDGGYVYDGKVVPFKTEEHPYKVLQPDGSLKEEPMTVRTTIQGPVFTRKDGTNVALRVAGLDRPGMLQEYWDMGKAHNFAEFQAALRTLQVPTFNIVYADRDGHIMYLYNGMVPVHPEGGDQAKWRGLIDGSTSATLWTKLHSYDDLPKVIDPATGFVQNTNDPPWIPTWPSPLKPSMFPPYMAPLTGVTMRSEQSDKLMLSKPKFTYDEFVKVKFDTYALLADRVLPELFAAAENNSDPTVRQAIAVLKQWDRHFDADSKGALLFEDWMMQLMGPALTSEANFAHPFSLDDPLNTPAGLKDPTAAVQMLAKAADETKKLYGSIDRPYGEVTRFKVGDLSLPAFSGSGSLGIFPSMGFGKLVDGKRDATTGETWISIVEFGPTLRAEGLMTYGNSTQPGTKHRTDQVQLFADRKLRTLWTTRTEVQQHLESKDTY
jgi:acyl-homoserine-lactone acylase